NAAPLVVLAIGQYFVIVSGEFDLSVGSLVGAQVVIAAALINGEESRTWPVIGLMILVGLLVGLVNGLVTTVLRVPSFITTLGTMLVLYGAIRLWTGGAPIGALSESFRKWGRLGIDMPVVRQLPYALIIMVVLAVVAVDRKSTRLNSSHVKIAYAGGCLKKKRQCGGRGVCSFLGACDVRWLYSQLHRHGVTARIAGVACVSSVVLAAAHFSTLSLHDALPISIGALSESFRKWGRLGIDMPVVRQLPYALIIMVVLAVVA